MIILRRVLVATDFGDAAAVALAYGRALAQTYHAELHVLHVVEDVTSRALVMAAGTPDEIAIAQMGIENDARKQAEALLTDADRRDLKASASIEVSGAPAAAIVAYAKRVEADLIIIGTHGRGPVSHLFLGNVAERVVRTAPCPVLTVRHPEHEFVQPEPNAPGRKEV